MKKLIAFVVLVGGVFLGSWQNNKFALAPQSILACDYCILTKGFTPFKTRPGFGVRMDARYTVLNSVFSGTNQVQNHESEKETHFTTQLTLFHNFSEKFTVVGIMPIPRREVSLDMDTNQNLHDEEKTEEEHGHAPSHGHNASGVAFNMGDLNILAKYTFLQFNTFSQSTVLSLEAGVKIPTGETNAVDAEGNFLDAHIQPGTGSWNYLLGFSLSHINNYFGLSSNLLYSLNTTGDAGNDDYRYGNWLNADVTAMYKIFATDMRNRSLFLTLGISGEFRGKEEINTQVIDNTGGEVLYLAPGFQFMFSSTLAIEGSLQFPFYHNLNGEEQLGENMKTFFGFRYLF